MRAVLCNFIFVLALAIAGREVPECANLEDDVSNDGRTHTASLGRRLSWR